MDDISILMLFMILLCISHYGSSNLSNDSGYFVNFSCETQWPRIDLILPLKLIEGNPRNQEWDYAFYHSFLMFWPQNTKNTTLTLVIDEELEGSEMVQEIHTKLDYYKNVIPKQTTIPVNIHYDLINKVAYKHGYDRQQYVMYTADLYSDAEYIAFVDTDSFIHSYVSYHDIFEDGKPIVKGYLQKYNDTTLGSFMKKWSELTFYALQLKQPFMCMTYFPMVVKAIHLQQLRTYIQHRMETNSFDEAVKSFIHGSSQFCIMCTYLWWMRRNEYVWYLHDINPEWDGRHPSPVYGQFSNKKLFTQSMMIPVPHIATHLNHLRDYPNNTIEFLFNLTIESLCWRNPQSSFHVIKEPSLLTETVLERYKKECGNIDFLNYSSYFEGSYHFEKYYDFTSSDANAMKIIQERRRSKIAACNQTIIMV